MGQVINRSSTKHRAALTGALVVLVLAAYLPLLRIDGPTTSDTFMLLAAHRTLEGALLHPLMSPLAGDRFYRPVAQLAYWLVWNLFGTSYRWYFLLPILVHLTSSLALFESLRRRVSLVGAFTGAAFFAVHPSMVDIVPGMDRWADMLMGLGLMATLLAVEGIDRRSWRLAAVAGCSFFAVAAKEPGILIPALVAAASIRRGWREALLAGATSGAAAAVFVGLRLLVLGARPGGYSRYFEAPLIRDYAYRMVFPTPWIAHPGTVLGWVSLPLLVALCLWLGRLYLPAGLGVLLLGLFYWAFGSFAPWHLYAPLALLGLGLGHAAARASLKGWPGRATLAVTIVMALLTLWGVPRHWLDRSWPAIGRVTRELSVEIVEAARRDRKPIFAVIPAHIAFDPSVRCYSTWNSILYPDSIFGLLDLFGAPPRFAMVTTARFSDPRMMVTTRILPGDQLEMTTSNGSLRPWGHRSRGLWRTDDYVSSMAEDQTLLVWWLGRDREMYRWSDQAPHLRRAEPPCRGERIGHPLLPGQPPIGWHASGDAFGDPLTRTGATLQREIFNPSGIWMINSFTEAGGDAPTGRLRSLWRPLPEGATHLCAWIGGGGRRRDLGLIVRGERTGELRLQGVDSEMLILRCAPVASDQRVQVELVDEDQGAWGHLIVGEISFYRLDCGPGVEGW